MTRLLTAIVALALALPSAAPAAAAPHETNAPPGNSAIDEYLETVPAATGDRRLRPRASPRGSGGLTSKQRTELERRGPDGAMLAQLVDEASPDMSAAESGPTTGATEVGSVPSVASGRSPVAATLAAAAGGDAGVGMGLVLPILLGVSALVIVAGGIARRRDR